MIFLILPSEGFHLPPMLTESSYRATHMSAHLTRLMLITCWIPCYPSSSSEAKDLERQHARVRFEGVSILVSLNEYYLVGIVVSFLPSR
jgi:hypothetical protein